MGLSASFRNNLVLAGIGSLALAALAPLPTLAAPGITLQASFSADGSNSGNFPIKALTAAGNGLYYGPTSNGGANGNGAIFVFDPTTGSITFQGSLPGSSGDASELTAAGNSLYYFTMSAGGPTGNGSIFSFDSTTSSIILQASFTGSNGSTPKAALIAAGNGLYYGTTSSGGANGVGSIFAFDSTTGSITLRGSFTVSNGANPSAALTAAGNGLYYGTTDNGGAVPGSRGGIFAFDSATGSITLQDTFTGPTGANPVAALTAAGNGLYYGTTRFGGANDAGARFAFDSTTGSIALQDSFTGANGAEPLSAMIAAGNGLYYGTTDYGGDNNKGSVYEFNSATGLITLKSSFTGANGSFPRSQLTSAGNGLYYGTALGGVNNTGAIFAFDSGVPDSNPVPGPLPLMGAGAAFGWSRRLRRRIQAVRPVFPVGL